LHLAIHKINLKINIGVHLVIRPGEEKLSYLFQPSIIPVPEKEGV